MNAKELFGRCLDLDAADRDALLATAEPALREEVRTLLEAHESSDAFLDPGIARPLFVELGPTFGKFQVGAELGRGGMGVVYAASTETPRRDVALKVLPTHGASKRALARFEGEAEALARLNHPAITQIYESGTFEEGGRNHPYIAMERVRGMELSEWTASGPSIQARLDFAIALARGVQEAHDRGVIHRDLKPSNVMVVEGGSPKILDFGIARIHDAGHALTLSGEIVGTLAYMSPEQAAGGHDDVDARSDQYALAAIVYELACGRLPVEVGGLSLTEAVRAIVDSSAPRLQTLDSALPRDLGVVLDKALAKEPRDRYPTMAAFADDLARVRAGEPILARPQSTWRGFVRWTARNRMVAALAFGLILVAVVSIVQLTSINHDLRRAQGETTQSLGQAREALILARDRGASLEKVNEEVRRVLQAERAALREAERDRERALGIERGYTWFFTGGQRRVHWDPKSPFEEIVNDYVDLVGRGLEGTPAAIGSAMSVASRLLLGLERSADALRCIDAAIANFEKEGDSASDHARSARVHAHLDRARVLLHLNRREDAVRACEQATRLFEPIDLVELVDALAIKLDIQSFHANLSLDLGRVDLARELVLAGFETLATAREAEVRVMFDARFDLASAAWRLGMVDPARELLERLDRRLQGEDWLIPEVKVLGELILFALAENRMADATSAGTRLEARLQAGNEVPARVALVALDALSELDSRVQGPAAARQRLEAALPLQAQVRLPVEAARRLTNLAIFCRELDDHAAAVAAAKSALKALKDLLPEAPVLDRRNRAYNTICFAEIGAGNHAAALIAMDACLELRARLSGTASLDWFNGQYTKAFLLWRLGRLRDALKLLDQFREPLDESGVEGLMTDWLQLRALVQKAIEAQAEEGGESGERTR